jgi:hypothetical protein
MMDELTKSINSLIKEIRTLTGVIESVLLTDDNVHDADTDEDKPATTYLDGTPIA